MAGIPHDACLGLALQVPEKLPTIPIDLTYHTPIPIMLAYALGSYAYQTWHEDGEGTSALSGDARACHILSQTLVQLALGEGEDDNSPDRSASPAHFTGSAAPYSPRHSPSKSPVQEFLSGPQVKWIPLKPHSQCLLTSNPQRICPGL